jgi:predicted kinase
MPSHGQLPARPAPSPRRFRCVAHPAPQPLDRASGLLNLLIGVAGGGKTSFYATAADELGIRESLDAARALYGTGPEDQSVTPQAVAHVIAQVEQLLREGQRVTVDATSTTAEERATWLGLAAAAGVPAIAYWITTPVNVARQRNASRARHVDDDVIAEHGDRLAALTIDDLYAEGFAAVCEVHTVPLDAGPGTRPPARGRSGRPRRRRKAASAPEQ